MIRALLFVPMWNDNVKSVKQSPFITCNTEKKKFIYNILYILYTDSDIAEDTPVSLATDLTSSLKFLPKPLHFENTEG